jgi:hypothetical protein
MNLYGPGTMYSAGLYSEPDYDSEPDPRHQNPAAWSTRDPGPQGHVYTHRATRHHHTDEWDPPLDLTLPCFEWPLSTDAPPAAWAAIEWAPPWLTWEPIPLHGDSVRPAPWWRHPRT